METVFKWAATAYWKCRLKHLPAWSQFLKKAQKGSALTTSLLPRNLRSSVRSASPGGRTPSQSNSLLVEEITQWSRLGNETPEEEFQSPKFSDRICTFWKQRLDAVFTRNQHSFLYRELNLDESIVSPSSRAPNCNKEHHGNCYPKYECDFRAAGWDSHFVTVWNLISHLV